MTTVTGTRLVIIVGARPRSSAADLVADARPGEETVLLVLGLDPTAAQRRLIDEALSLAEERQLPLSAELVPAAAWLRERLRPGDRIRVAAHPREARRWGLGPSLSPSDG